MPDNILAEPSACLIRGSPDAVHCSPSHWLDHSAARRNKAPSSSFMSTMRAATSDCCSGDTVFKNKRKRPGLYRGRHNDFNFVIGAR